MSADVMAPTMIHKTCFRRLGMALILASAYSSGFAGLQNSQDADKRQYWAKVDSLGKPFSDLQQLVKDLAKYHTPKDAKKYFSLLADSYEDNGKKTLIYADKLAAIPAPAPYATMMQKYIGIMRASGDGMKKLAPLARSQNTKELNKAWAKFSKLRTDNVQTFIEVSEEHKKYSK